VADRTDYDLKRHQDYSKEDMTYFDPDTNEKYMPFVIEPSMGLDRLMLMTMIDSYDEEALEDGDTRVVMHLLPSLAPYKIAVLPLSKKLEDKANEVLPSLINTLCAPTIQPVQSANVIAAKTRLARRSA
jgi:glycyl-tRNA synthetase